MAFAALATVGVIATVQAEEVVNVYNWSDYIEESVLSDFEKATGIKV
ncbi:MAG: spermidine/putrescine ABC transporter substrate-binding protein PotF, partial [Gammaproteobacteria bacterium]